jgi:hypothetical protein
MQNHDSSRRTSHRDVPAGRVRGLLAECLRPVECAHICHGLVSLDVGRQALELMGVCKLLDGPNYSPVSRTLKAATHDPFCSLSCLSSFKTEGKTEHDDGHRRSFLLSVLLSVLA